jgi:DNA-binding CsgD family transcriptional regulator
MQVRGYVAFSPGERPLSYCPLLPAPSDNVREKRLHESGAAGGCSRAAAEAQLSAPINLGAMANDEAPRTAGRRVRPGRHSGGLAASLPWIALILVALFWCVFVLGIAIALVDKGAAAWWVMLVFGALPLIGFYRIALHLVNRRPASPPHTNESLPVNGAPAARATSATDAPDLVEPLTARELEVLALLDKGRTNGQIAHELYVSTATVKSHVNNLLRKLGAANRTEAVAQARHLDLIS